MPHERFGFKTLDAMLSRASELGLELPERQALHARQRRHNRQPRPLVNRFVNQVVRFPGHCLDAEAALPARNPGHA